MSKLFLHQHFLNIDISLPISYKPFKFSTCIHDIQVQGCMSQILFLGPSFDFMKSRNLEIKKKEKKLPFSLHKINTRTFMKKI